MFTYDEMIELENILIGELKGLATVDGHDIGVGEINYFILTDEVNVVFDKIKLLLKDEVKKLLKAAYRKVHGDKYHIIYPPDLDTFSIT